VQCLEPGEVLVLPREDSPENLIERISGTTEDEVDILYSTEDILRHYELTEGLERLQSESRALPFVATVPEGQELEYAARFREREKLTRAATAGPMRRGDRQDRRSVAQTASRGA
jgi:hypothetical protein